MKSREKQTTTMKNAENIQKQSKAREHKANVINTEKNRGKQWKVIKRPGSNEKQTSARKGN